MERDVIIACDFSDKSTCLDFIDLFGEKSKKGEKKPFVKIGMELYYSVGPDIVKELKNRGHKVFLDLKLHDIPNTVQKAMSVLAGLGVDMCNVHAGGGSAMMEAAMKGLGGKTKLIAVTQLTSTSQQRLEDELLIQKPMDEVVKHYAECASKAGLDGVVCSPLEAGAVKERCGASFLTVTPGVRFAEEDAGDQVRITTPEAARKLGSDYIVVGRPITQAQDPVAAYMRCVKEFLGGC